MSWPPSTARGRSTHPNVLTPCKAMVSDSPRPLTSAPSVRLRQVVGSRTIQRPAGPGRAAHFRSSTPHGLVFRLHQEPTITLHYLMRPARSAEQPISGRLHRMILSSACTESRPLPCLSMAARTETSWLRLPGRSRHRRERRPETQKPRATAGNPLPSRGRYPPEPWSIPSRGPPNPSRGPLSALPMGGRHLSAASGGVPRGVRRRSRGVRRRSRAARRRSPRPPEPLPRPALHLPEVRSPPSRWVVGTFPRRPAAFPRRPATFPRRPAAFPSRLTAFSEAHRSPPNPPLYRRDVLAPCPPHLHEIV